MRGLRCPLSLIVLKLVQELTDKYDFVTGHRGMGYMQGLILTIPVADVVKNCKIVEDDCEIYL